MGGELLMPSPGDEQREWSNFYAGNVEGPMRLQDPPEKGLWEEYDGCVNGIF
jgi:hypothetical protein